MEAVVLGVGNVLLQDEGIGVHVVQALQRRFDLPPEVTVLDGGTAGLGLVDDLLGREALLIIDAMVAEQPPGTILRLEGDAVPGYLRTRISPHQLGLSDLLATLELLDGRPQRLVLLGIVPQSLELSLQLSGVLAQRLDELADRVVEELERWGIACRRL